MALPSGQRTKIKDIFLHTKTLDAAGQGRSVVLTTTDHIDLGRGDMLVDAENVPTASARVMAHLIWLAHTPLRKNARYLVKHTTRVLCGKVSQLKHKIEINTFEKQEADSLQFNEIGEVQLDLHSPIFCDPYLENRSTGSFILIDPFNNDTVAAGMITEAIPDKPGQLNDGAAGGSDVTRQRG